jgi:replicative DNA helicase
MEAKRARSHETEVMESEFEGEIRTEEKGAEPKTQLELEREILGVFFKEPSLDMAETLRRQGPPIARWSHNHRLIVQAAISLVYQGQEVDVGSVCQELESRDHLETVGGERYLNRLASRTRTPVAFFENLVIQFRNFHSRSRLRGVLESGLGLLESRERDPEQILNVVMEDLSKLTKGELLETPMMIGEVLDQVHEKTTMGSSRLHISYNTGFDALDSTIGGIRPGDLLLIGGAQGVGKTIMCLQMGRNIAKNGKAKVLYVCYEHDEQYLLRRLFSLESINPTSDIYQEGFHSRKINAGLEQSSRTKMGFRELLESSDVGQNILNNIESYRNNLYLFKGNALKTTLHSLRGLVLQLREESEGNLVMVVDYLQKVPVFPEPDQEEEKVTRIVEGLKDMALGLEIGIVAVVAADKEGLKSKRLRIHHLRGSSALQYECDACLILNDKSKIVSKKTVEHNLNRLKEFDNWVVCSVEKNRSGRKMVDLEFRKHFSYFCFDPRGRTCEAQLIEEKIFTE